MPLRAEGIHPGFKYWAIVSSAALGMMCVLAGVTLLHGETLIAQYDLELSRIQKWGLAMGLPALAIAWCGYMGLLALTATASRCRVGLRVAMSVWLLLSCWLSLVFIAGWVRLMFGGMRMVM